MNQHNTRVSRYLAIIAALVVLLDISVCERDTAPSVCLAAEVEPTEGQQVQLRLSDLEWALGVSARDDHQDPIRAAHHFFRAARAAKLAGQQSRADSYLIAAMFPSRALDRYLIHPVRGAAFGPDSTRLLTYDNSPVVRLWDVGQTEPLRSFRHDGEILSASFSRDATRVLSDSRDGSVRLWKTDQAEPLAILRHDGEVAGAMFTADETKILSWSKDKTARLWDVKKPTEPLYIFRHDEAITGAVFNAAETKLLTCGNDFAARLWDAKTGKMIHKLVYEPRDHLDKFMKSAVTDAAFCNMESQISFRCYDGTWLWDAASGKLIDRFFYGEFSDREPQFITLTKGVVAFYRNAEDMSHSPRKASRTFHHGLDVDHELNVQITAFNDIRTRFLTQLDLRAYGHTHNGWVQLWNIDGEKPLLTCQHNGPITGAAMMKHKQQVLTHSQDGTARIWDIDPRRELRTVRHRRPVAGALLSPNERLLLTWTDNGAARLTELHREDGGDVLGRLIPEYPGHFAWTRLPPDGLRAVTWGAYETTIRYVDIQKNLTLRSFSLDGDVDSVTLSPDGSHVLATADGSGWFWSLRDGQPNLMIECNEKPVVFNDDASQVFVRNKRNEGVLYDVKQRKATNKFLHAGEEYIDKVVFSEDGIRVFTRGLQRVQLWDIDGDEPLRTFQRDGRISRVAFSAEGEQLITWDESGGGVHLWDVDDKKPRHRFDRSDDFDGAVFSPDAKQILSWSDSYTGTARLWNVETGRLLRIFGRHGHIIQGRFTPDGKRVVTFTWRKNAHLWDPHQEEPLQTLHLTKRARRPVFADGLSSLIIQADDKVTRWQIAANQEQTIERQQRKYEIKTATRLDQSGRLRPLSLEQWQHLKSEVGQ